MDALKASSTVHRRKLLYLSMSLLPLLCACVAKPESRSSTPSEKPEKGPDDCGGPDVVRRIPLFSVKPYRIIWEEFVQ